MVQFDQSPAFEERERILQTAVIIWFVSIRPDGSPHVVPVWFHWDGVDSIILSRPGTQKVRNVAANPHVSIAVDDSNGGRTPVAFDGIANLESLLAMAPRPERLGLKYAAQIAEMEWSPAELFHAYSQAIRVTPTRFLTIT